MVVSLMRHLQSLFFPMAFQPTSLISAEGYSVWVFVLGAVAGPRRMVVRREEDNYLGILANQKVFGKDTAVEIMMFTIDEKLYRVYFGQVEHKANRLKATYVFMRLQDRELALNICIEDDLPNILDALTRCVAVNLEMWGIFDLGL